MLTGRWVTVHIKSLFLQGLGTIATSGQTNRTVVILVDLILLLVTVLLFATMDVDASHVSVQPWHTQ